ncbi:MAG: xylose isomerase [Chloroflexi bacterium]|nr:xylose isomerase [Chloroflexota bacterium]MBV9600738.1 xylose isomerase [Chloroflexota bacterium]
MAYEPRKEDRFTTGLWCTAFSGREVFGVPVRPPLDPLDNIRGLARIGCYGFAYHDDDLIPFGASASEGERIIGEAQKVMDGEGIKNTMATCNLFEQPVFKDGAFTSNDARIRAFAIQKSLKAIDLGARLGASVYVMWGGREGLEVEASKNPVDSVKRYREAVEFLAHYIRGQGYAMRIAIEPKPNEPRGDIFLATIGHVLAFISTLDPAIRDLVGVNPEIQHSRMAGMNTVHEVAQALEMGKLYHFDLGAQKPTRYDQDLRFGSEDIKESFFIVKLLEDHGWSGPRHFDVKPYRPDSVEEVFDLVAGCMRSYLVLREKVQRFNADAEIQTMLRQLQLDDDELVGMTRAYSSENVGALKARSFNLSEMAERKLGYQRLDQLVFDLLTGAR